jgi:hypothetical protein
MAAAGRRFRLARGLVTAGAVASAVITAHTLVNLRRIRRPQPWTPADGAPIAERVSILLPARNEAARIEATLRSLMDQDGVPDLEILVLDDGSTDGTGDVVRRVAGDDPRVVLLSEPDDPPPPGWLGKPWACHRLSKAATGSALVFIDADVELDRGAVAASVSLMRALQMQLVSPYPRQVAGSWAERLTQPLVSWSWMATLPVDLVERSANPTWAAAIGQFIVVDTDAYRAAGGHEPLADLILDDVAVLRMLKRNGQRGIPVDGSQIARCRMYTSARETYEGYTKNLWAVFGPGPGPVGGLAAMALIYVLPPVAALVANDRSTRAWGAFGYLTGVAGRVAVARKTGERVWPDALAQPASIGAFGTLLAASLVKRSTGRLTWKGRSIPGR